MPEEWIVRVGEKEFGPVDLETLLEWKSEGRVLRQNPVRRPDLDDWLTAGEIPGLFDPVPVQPSRTEPEPLLRSFGQVCTATLQIYIKGFRQYFCLTLLVLVPWLFLQLIGTRQPSSERALDVMTLLVALVALFMFVLSIVIVPIYIAAIQVTTAGLVSGRGSGFFGALNEAAQAWPRVALLCIMVYGAFFLLIVFAMGIALMLVAGAGSLFMIFLALVLLAFQVWMFGRVFINVLFWQQVAVLEGVGVAASLRESKRLARSGHHLPWFQRPLWRGAFLASIFFAIILALNLMAEWETLQTYFRELTIAQSPQELLQKMQAHVKSQGFDLQRFLVGLVQRLLQPLLGIGFVLLYFDAKRVVSEDQPPD